MCLVARGRTMGCGKSRHSPVTSQDDVTNGSRKQSAGEKRKGNAGSQASPGHDLSGSEKGDTGSGGVHNTASGLRASQSKAGLNGAPNSAQNYTLEVPSEINRTHHPNHHEHTSPKPRKGFIDFCMSVPLLAMKHDQKKGAPEKGEVKPKKEEIGTKSSEGCLKGQNGRSVMNLPNPLDCVSSKDLGKDKPKIHHKDFKTLTSSKTIHITNSQIEFFKMLDEKIEQGVSDISFSESNTSEITSSDSNFRH